MAATHMMADAALNIFISFVPILSFCLTKTF
jgi:hypothetical protein